MANAPEFRVVFPSEIYLKIGDYSKAVKSALADTKRLEQEMARVQMQGKSLKNILRQRELEFGIRQLDGVVNQGRAMMAQQSDALARVRLNAASKMGAQAGNVNASPLLSRLGINPNMAGPAALATAALGIPSAMTSIRDRIADHERNILSNPFMTRNQKMAAELRTKQDVIGEIPLVGGALKKLSDVGTGLSNLWHGEESITRLEKKTELDQLVRRNPAIAEHVTQRLTLARRELTEEGWAKLMDKPSPAVERLIGNIKDANAAFEQGTRAASVMNIYGNKRKGGAGGAQDWFNRANALCPGIGPYNAAQNAADIDAARIAGRNFARAQMTRVYRTAD